MRKRQEENTEENDVSKLRIPLSLTLRDMITIIAVAMTLTTAWATFGSRITFVEREVVELRQKVNSIGRTVRELEDNQRNDDIFIDQLYEHLKRSPPNRYNSRSSRE